MGATGAPAAAPAASLPRLPLIGAGRSERGS